MFVGKILIFFLLISWLSLVQHGPCVFYKSEDIVKRNNIYKVIGLNAAHSMIPPNTLVKIRNENNNEMITVTINGLNATMNNTLELSTEAAIELGIKKEGAFPCSLTLLPNRLNYENISTFVLLIIVYFVIIISLTYW